MDENLDQSGDDVPRVSRHLQDWWQAVDSVSGKKIFK